LHFSRKRQDGSAPNFFQGLGENTCLLQPALKSTLHTAFMQIQIQRYTFVANYYCDKKCAELSNN